jgi:FAD/FMN-containing dehydrogenase
MRISPTADETAVTEGLEGRLLAALGPGAVLTEPADMAGYAVDWRGLYQGRPLAVTRPSTVAEVAAVVTLCASSGAPVVPQGGNTSMVGGATPSAAGTAVVLSLERLRRVRAIDPVDMTMTVEAGLTLRQAQEAAAAAGLLFPLSISSEGSAQIGGVLATNAGGNTTLRFGNAPYGTGCGICTRTTPAIACGSCSSARRGRSASSPRPCCVCNLG